MYPEGSSLDGCFTDMHISQYNEPLPSQSPSLPGLLEHVGPQETLPAASDQTPQLGRFLLTQRAGKVQLRVVHQHVFANSEDERMATATTTPPSLATACPSLSSSARAPAMAAEPHLIKLHNSATNSAASFSPREPARSNCARRGSTSIAGGGAPTRVVHQHVFANSEMGGAPCSKICFRMNCQKTLRIGRYNTSDS
jgi:hypothetical protein